MKDHLYLVVRFGIRILKYFFIGLPTGSSPIPTYKRLVEFHKRGELSFENVVTFNLVRSNLPTLLVILH